MRSSFRRSVRASLVLLLLGAPVGCCGLYEEEEFPDLPDFVRENRCRERCERARERAREGRCHDD